VRWNRLTVWGIDVLARAPGLAGLTRLDVTGNPGGRGVLPAHWRDGNNLVF
jgi:hypothetical protein